MSGTYGNQNAAGHGAPKGNKNAVGNAGQRRAKLFKDALTREIAKCADNNLGAGMDRIARKLLDAALGGEPWAIQEIANRIDGRPAQSVELSGDDEAPLIIQRIERIVVNGSGTENPDG